MGATSNPVPSYTTAPPSYHVAEAVVAESPGSPLLEPHGSLPPRSVLEGAPDSDLPDDFKYSTTVSKCTISIRNAFVRKVYTILTAQLLMTGGLSTLFMFAPGIKFFVQSTPSLMWISLFGSIVLLLLTFWKRKSYPTNLFFLTGFTLVEGYSVATITTFYDSRIVVEALLLTLFVFGGLTVFAMQTKYDFIGWVPFMGMGLWMLIGFGFMAMFFPYSRTSELLLGGLGALIFSIYVVIDTQMIMKHYHPEEEIAASITLYLDFINLFLYILRILNASQNNR